VLFRSAEAEEGGAEDCQTEEDTEDCGGAKGDLAVALVKVFVFFVFEQVIHTRDASSKRIPL
jgi:hypothetical protein